MKHEYVIIGGDIKEYFERRVEEYHQAGWTLAGGVQISIINNKIFYFQSIYGVVKEKKAWG
ncbi:MAG: hypothetical protein ACKORE_11250 [Bacteroidota bacterium]